MARLSFKPNWGRSKRKMAAALYWIRKDRRAAFELIRVNVGELYSSNATINGSGTVT